MAYLLPILLLLIGLALGIGGAWLFLRTKTTAAYDRGRGEASAETAVMAEKVLGRDATIEELRRRLQEKDDAIVSLQKEVTQLNIAAAELKQLLAAEQKQSLEKLALLDDAKRQLSDAFKALASDALKSSNTSFLELAKTQLEKFQESAKDDLGKRQTAIDEMVKPVRESLGKVDAKLQEIEKSRIDAYSSLTQQVKTLAETQKDLRGETANLVKALRRPQARGRWGEIQLRRVVEMAGMLEHCDFVEQQSTDTDSGRLRPDMVVKLPGRKSIVVDSKAPLEAYLEAVEATDDTIRAAKFKDHARQVRNHIALLGQKAYFEQFDSPEFVGAFPAGRGFFQRGIGKRSRIDRVGREPECDYRHADDLDCAVASRGLRLAAGSVGREREGHQRAWPRALQTSLRPGRSHSKARQGPERGGERLQQRGRLVGVARVGQRPAFQGARRGRRRGDRRHQADREHVASASIAGVAAAGNCGVTNKTRTVLRDIFTVCDGEGASTG